MTCKDCHKPTFATRPTRAWAVACALFPATVGAAHPAQAVRMWPQAVVVDEQIRLGDLCELTGFDPQTHERLRNLAVEDSPPPGGSKVIELRRLGDLLAGAGINLAQTIVKGAAECGVCRPRMLPAGPAQPSAGGHWKDGSQGEPPAPATLRDAVVEFLAHELARYGGTVQVEFSPRSAAALDLAVEDFAFDIRRRTGRPLGMIDLDVDVRREGQVVQTVHLQPVVSLLRPVVVARRAINDQAAVRPEDVQVVAMTFHRLDQLGTTELDNVIGQRAKQFVPAGTLIELPMLESVPLVKRGQLVDVVSRSGGITVVTAGKAMGTAGLGETVELKGADRRSPPLVGVVTGPQRVELRDEAVALAGGAGVAYGGPQQ